MVSGDCIIYTIFVFLVLRIICIEEKHEANKAARSFQYKHPTIREPTVCAILKKRDQLVKENHSFKLSLEKKIMSLGRERSLLVESLVDTKVRTCLMTRFHKGRAYQ